MGTANIGAPSERDRIEAVRRGETFRRIEALRDEFKAQNDWADYGAVDAFVEYLKRL